LREADDLLGSAVEITLKALQLGERHAGVARLRVRLSVPRHDRG
jgi:hypothetical protein